MACSLWGASSLSIDPNNRVFFGPGHEHFRNLLDLEAKFGSNSSLLFVIHSGSALADSPAAAPAVRWLSERAWSIDHVVSVNSVANYPVAVNDDQSLGVYNLLDYVCPANSERCERERLELLFKPYLVNRLIDSDGASFAVIANVDLSAPTPKTVSLVADQANSLMKEFMNEFPQFELYLTGAVPMMQAFYDAASTDSSSLIVVALAVLSIMLFVFLGGVVPALMLTIVGIAAVTVSLGTAGWLGLIINTATATVPLIVFTLVVAAAMHVFLHILREPNLDSRLAIEKAVRTSILANWRPVALTAATTAVGLMSMGFVSAPPLRELGLLSAIGVVAGAIFSLTIVPVMFSVLSRVRRSDYLLGLQAAMNRYAKWVEQARPMMVPAFAIFAVALVGVGKLNIDEDFVRYFSPDTSFRSNTEAVTSLLAGPYHIDVVYDAGGSAGIYEPASLEVLEELSDYLRDDHRVVNVASILDVLHDVSLAFTGSSELAGRGAEELAQYFLSYELSLNIGQSAQDFVDVDHRQARVSVFLGDVSMRDIRDLVESIDRWSEDNGIADRVVVSGEGVPTAYLSSESVREMSTGIAISILMSALMVGLYFRDLRVSLTIFAASLLPVVAGFGVWGWTGSEIGMAATLVVATTIGVVIDDTIHFTYRYLVGARTLDLSRWGAVAYSIHKTGTAILVTSITLVAGLLVLVASDFRMNSTFGVCSSLVIGLALLYNLSIAPRLLDRLRAG